MIQKPNVMPEDSMCRSCLSSFPWFLLQRIDSRTEKLLQQPKHLELSQGKPLAVGARHICPLSHTHRAPTCKTLGCPWDVMEGGGPERRQGFREQQQQPLTPCAKWKILANRGLKMKERWRVGSKKEDEKENGGDKWKPKITRKRWHRVIFGGKKRMNQRRMERVKGKKEKMWSLCCRSWSAGHNCFTRRLSGSLFLSRTRCLTDNSPWLSSASDPSPSTGSWLTIGRCSTALHCRWGTASSLPPSAPPPPRQTKTTLLPPLCPSSASAIPTMFTLIIVHRWHPTLCRVYSSA